MSKIYFCYIKVKGGQRLVDSFTNTSLCAISSLDFERLNCFGYIVEVLDVYYVGSSSAMCRYRRLSHRISDYIINFGKLPNFRRL